MIALRKSLVLHCFACPVRLLSPDLRPGDARGPPDALSRRLQGQGCVLLWWRSVAGVDFGRRGATHYVFSGRELFPKFSPDGKWIAFTGQYDGNFNVYVMPADGGQPKQLTFYQGSAHQLNDRMGIHDEVINWTPDSKRIVFLSRRDASNGWIKRPFTVSIDGGLPQPLPMDQGGLAFLFARWHEDRLQHDLPQLPHLEALHRRSGPVDHDLRPQEQHQPRYPAHGLDGHISDVA